MKIKMDKLINSLLAAGVTIVLVLIALCFIHEIPHIPEAEFYAMLSDSLTWAIFLIALWGFIKLSYFICDKVISDDESDT